MASWATTDEVERLKAQRDRLKVMCNDYDLALGRAQAHVAVLTAALRTLRALPGVPADEIAIIDAALDAAGGAS